MWRRRCCARSAVQASVGGSSVPRKAPRRGQRGANGKVHRVQRARGRVSREGVERVRRQTRGRTQTPGRVRRRARRAGGLAPAQAQAHRAVSMHLEPERTRRAQGLSSKPRVTIGDGQNHADDHRSHCSNRGHQADTLSPPGQPPVGPPRTAHKLKKRQKQR